VTTLTNRVQLMAKQLHAVLMAHEAKQTLLIIQIRLVYFLDFTEIYYNMLYMKLFRPFTIFIRLLVTFGCKPHEMGLEN